MRIFLQIVFWALSCSLAQAMQLGVTSDEINLSSLIRELNLNPPLQAELEVFPSQFEKLQTLVSRSEFKKIVTTIDFVPKSANSDAFFEADQQMLKLLDGVLDPQQIVALRRMFVKLRFASKFKETLQSNTVMRYIGVEEQFRDEYKAELNQVLKENDRLLRGLDDRRIRQFLKLLPTECQQNMAQLVGAKYYPEEIVDSSLYFEALPFADGIKGIYMLKIILRDQEFEAGLRLSPEQRASLEKIAAEENKDLEKVMAMNTTSNFNSEFDAHNDRSRQRPVEFLNVLDAKQKLAMGRISIQKQLEHDVQLVVKLPGLQSYLALDNDAWKKFVSEVDEQDQRFADQKQLLNRKMLERLGKAMGSKVQSRLNFLLGEVW